MGPVPLGGGGGYNRRTHPRGTTLSPGGQLISSVRTISPLYVPSIGTSPNHSVFILVHQSLIRMKIRANHSGNFWFEYTCTYRTIFDSNENPEIFDSNAHARTKQFSIHSHARTKQFSIRMKIRAQSNYQTIFDSNENQSIGCYVVITYITQIGVVRNQRAIRNQRACSTQL